MKRFRIPLQVAHEHVLNLKFDIKPNNGFMQRLVDYGKLLDKERINQFIYRCRLVCEYIIN